ncbi:DUF222 domain-containing protein [Kribbella sp. VKM Ac-2568]|uniref:DUF222 domain-containing protein n=1 Tax=Kribbella sp. VKM Ac-2568 TaxID=2512219 RepID=UPI001044B9CD|nr:DUF222 domain-containing protein [Kribbella sp. VKM Ac-2568]TCM50464.1 uncharacterized protein DUF222 [Kribbella sp. VKM Ac-2568]
MFDEDVADLDATETLVWAAEVHELRTQAEVRLVELAQHFADLHPDPATVPGRVSLAGGERGVVYGGAGCPAIAEFAAAEFGAMIGRSAGSAAVFIGQSLALRHRLPRIWAQVKGGHGEPWKARTIATACLALSVEAAAIVDRRVAGMIDTVTPVRLEKIVRAAVQQADPDAARAAGEARAKERGVWAGRTDDHGTTTLYVRAATGDVIHFKATIRQIADALAQLGDTDSLPRRKAKAIGIIADPALTNELLTVAHHLTPTTTAPNAEAVATTAPASAKTGPDKAGTGVAANPAPGTADHTAQWQPADLPVPLADETGDVAGGGEDGATGWVVVDEPGEHDEADRDPPHPDDPVHDRLFCSAGLPEPGPADDRCAETPEPAGDGAGLGGAARQEVARKLAAIKQGAYSDRGGGVTGRRPARTTLYVHLTDQTLLAGGGVARVERFGPVFAARLEELLGHDQIVVKPVIDLNDKLSVDAYEIPRRIRERVKLTHPVEQFVFGAAETTDSVDLDHIAPFDFNATGPPGQTGTDNLTPLRRYSHRVKTHGGWRVHRLDDGALEWTTKHGFKFRVDHTGTHPLADHTDASRPVVDR